VKRILDRTAKGIDRTGNPFKGYSKAYSESLMFAQAGKTSTVDLRLFGDMLNDITVLSTEGNLIKIGFTDPEQDKKAQGHITGKDGVVSKNGKHYPIRDFLGLPQKEIDEMGATFSSSASAISRLDALSGIFLQLTGGPDSSGK